MAANIQKFYYHLELAEQALLKAKNLREQATEQDKLHETSMGSARAHCNHNYERSGSYEAVCTNCGNTINT